MASLPLDALQCTTGSFMDIFPESMSTFGYLAGHGHFGDRGYLRKRQALDTATYFALPSLPHCPLAQTFASQVAEQQRCDEWP
jgi:hypothetical protein